MRVLAIDTALGQCAACLLDTNDPEPIAAEAIRMDRGHAEALLPLIDRVVSRVEGGFATIDEVAVTIGPGSFTGLRVGIAAARAIGVAVGCTVVGVTTLSALMAPLLEGATAGLIVAAIDARGGRIYGQALAASGRVIVPPGLLTIREVVRALGSGPVVAVGSGAAALVQEALSVGVEARRHPGSDLPDLAWVARLAAAADPEEALPRPFYLAAPGATPQDGARLPQQ